MIALEMSRCRVCVTPVGDIAFMSLCRKHFGEWKEWYELKYGEEARQRQKGWLARGRKPPPPLVQADVWRARFEEFLAERK